MAVCQSPDFPGLLGADLLNVRGQDANAPVAEQGGIVGHQVMVLSGGDPLIIKCMGGLVQTVPQAKIASVKKMERSLMYQPQQLGLTAQAIADIVAYLKSGQVK